MSIPNPCSPHRQAQPPAATHLEQVVPSPFGSFGSFGSFLSGVAADRAANLLPGGRVVFLPVGCKEPCLSFSPFLFTRCHQDAL